MLDGVRLKAGPNVIALTPIYANDRRGEPVYETVYAPGRPTRVEIAFARKPVADGRTPINVVVRAFDTWNHAPAPGVDVNVTVVTGNATLSVTPSGTEASARSASATSPNAPAMPDASTPLAASPFTPSRFASNVPASVALQPASIANRRVEGVLGDDGTFRAQLVAGQLPGDVQLTAVVGDASGTQDALAEPFARQPLVIGLVSVGAGSMPGPVNGDDIFDNGGSRRGRIAFYGSGNVGAQTTATLAYETANRLEPSAEFGPYTFDPQERTYLTYGDASQRADDALSRNHLYARVDRGHDSLMYGEFDAQTGSADSVGSFEALLSGPKLRIADNRDRASLTAFTADNQVAYGRATINPLGLSTIGRLLHVNLIVGSESINLASLDRRTGVVISQTPMTRNVDYTIDYYSGLLRFITIPLPYDAYFNPQVIVAQYQYDGQASGARTSGGRVAGALGRDGAIHVGFGYVNDSTGLVKLHAVFARRGRSDSRWNVVVLACDERRRFRFRSGRYADGRWEGRRATRFDCGRAPVSTTSALRTNRRRLVSAIPSAASVRPVSSITHSHTHARPAIGANSRCNTTRSITASKARVTRKAASDCICVNRFRAA